MKVSIAIRRAQPQEHETLTEISFAAKRYWNDPEAYFDVWRKELTITRGYIENNAVFAAEAQRGIVGYFSIAHVPEDFTSGKVFVRRGYWLEHIFIRPEYLRHGVGTQLIGFARDWCARQGVERLFIFSDPHARGFYERVGARYLGESASSIPGRTVPMFELSIK